MSTLINLENAKTIGDKDLYYRASGVWKKSGVVPVDPGLLLLQNATLWLDAADAIPGSQWIRNKGMGGRALDARLGSVGSAQIVNGALKLPGVVGNFVSVPDSAALKPSAGDLEVLVRISLSDLTPGVTHQLVGKNDNGGSINYDSWINTSGGMSFTFRDGGGVQRVFATSPAVPFDDGTVRWLRFVLSSNTSSGTATCTYQWADDSPSVPTSWTTLSAPTSNTNGGISTVSTQPLRIGGTWTAGVSSSVFRAIVRDSVGTPVFDADFTTVPNLATSFTESSANAATVTINSTSGVDTNDPLPLPNTIENYLYLPGTVGNTASATGLSQASMADFDIMMQMAPNDWTVTPNAWGLVAFSIVGATRTIRLNYSASTDRIGMTIMGVADYSSNAAHSLTDGSFSWIRATYQSSSGNLKFYTAPGTSDGSVPGAWTQLGTTVTAASGHSTGTVSSYTVGPNATELVGGVRNVRVLNGYDGAGSVVFDANFTANTNQSTFTESSSNAATITINRATSGRKAVMVVRPTLLFSTDDYLEVANNVLLNVGVGEQITAFVVGREWATPVSNTPYISKTQSGFDDGWTVLHNAANLQVRTFVDSGAITLDNNHASFHSAGVYTLFGGIIDRVAQTQAPFLGSLIDTPTSISTVGTLVNSGPLRVAALGNNIEINHVVLVRGVLTSTELGQIATYLGV